MTDSRVGGTFGEVIKTFEPDIQAIAKALRSLITSIHGDFVEVVWPRQKIASFGVGPKKMSEHYAYIAPQRNYVNLGFYHGAVLPDPDELLEGAGKRLRHLKVKSASEVARKEVRRLLEAALSERKKVIGPKKG